MTTRLGGFGVPGSGDLEQTQHRELLWGGDSSKGMARFQNGIVSGASRDAGNTPTTVLRAGLILGTLTSSGEHEEWDADASDGTQDITGILDMELKAQDFDGNDADRVVRILKSAPVKASQLLIQGAAFVGHADEYLARRQLVAAGFQFDDDPFGYKAGSGNRVATVTGTTDTLTAAENGSTIFYSNAGSVTATLPAIKPGLQFDLIRSGDEEFVVASGEGDNIVAGNDLSADSITFTTVGEHLGAHVRVRSVYVGTTLKWLVELPNVPFGIEVGSTISMSIAT